MRQWLSSFRFNRTPLAVSTFCLLWPGTLVNIYFFLFSLYCFFKPSLGLSLFHLPSWSWEYWICRGRRLWFICIRMDFKDDSPALFSSSSLLILFLQELPMIDLKCLITYDCRLSVCTMYIVHVSALYNKSSQHSSIDLALHFYGNMVVIPKFASKLSIHCLACPILRRVLYPA